MKRIAVAILAAVIHSSASAQSLSDFKGIRLGAPLSEIRKLPYPDAARWPDAKLICTGDKERAQVSSEGSRPDDGLSKIGVVACGYYRPAGQKFTSLGLDFAGVTPMQTLLVFTPAGLPEEQRSRLYVIALEAPAQHFDAVLAGLRSTYGEPHDTQQIKFKSGGMSHDSVRLGWQAGDSIVVTERYFQDINTMYVGYQHLGLVKAAIRAEKKSP